LKFEIEELLKEKQKFEKMKQLQSSR